MLTFSELSENDSTHVSLLQALFEAAPDYSVTVEGRLPGPQDGLEALRALPVGKARADKVVGIYRFEGTVVGCLDIVRAHPEPHIAFVGLLLFAADHQGHGFGAEALRHIKELAQGWQCTRLRLAVIDTNTRALHFWKREGFYELYRKVTTKYTGAAIVMETAL